ncbi:hypothetical protein MZK47_02605 [Microbacterium aerolatum]|uniref:hypothetical protein n=1 Tax=Microbacterium aerolatum TaxID=153731 RepID=UPI0020010667|nr:hypothetical protein [Microbacterium aerolatum]MCK3768562.1 hypothetical protein [Microbacterium aerolatum]
MTILPADVADYLGRGDDDELVALAGQHLPIVTAWVKAYTRGVGFDIADDPDGPVAAVITAATARLSNNPDGTVTVSVDDYQTRKTVFEGFNLIERAILDGYRRKAA